MTYSRSKTPFILDKMFFSILLSVTVIAFLIGCKSVNFKLQLTKLKFHLKMALYILLLLLITTICLPFLIIRPKRENNGAIMSNLMKHITKIYGLKWHLRNEEILAEDRGAVIISNHQSILDISAVINVWHAAKKITPIGKKEIFYAGTLGIAAYLCGGIFIDRKNPKEAYKQMECVKKLTQNKTKIMIFPEGTRNKNCDGKLLPFKKGAFNIAVNAQVPIIPVVFSPYYFIDSKNYIFNNNGHVILQCLEPVSTSGLTLDDVPALADRLHQIMSRSLEQLCNEVLPETRKTNDITSKRPTSLLHNYSSVFTFMRKNN